MSEIYVSTSCLKGTGDLREIQEVYSAHGIENVELTGGLEYIQDLDGFLDHYSGTNFIIHNYFPPPCESLLMNLAAQDAFRIFARSIEKISDYARSRGVPIALENLEHKNEAYMMTRPEEFARFQEIFPEVGVLLDLGHLRVSSDKRSFID